jgi:hypothetical protein
VDNNIASIVSMSYGECESDLGVSDNAAWSDLWQQAVLERITVFVAAGDEGAAICDADLWPSPSYSTLGNLGQWLRLYSL